MSRLNAERLDDIYSELSEEMSLGDARLLGELYGHIAALTKVVDAVVAWRNCPDAARFRVCTCADGPHESDLVETVQEWECAGAGHVHQERYHQEITADDLPF